MTLHTSPSICLHDTTGGLYSVHVGATFLTGVEVDVASALVAPERGKGPGARLEECPFVPFQSSRPVLKRSDGFFYAVNGSEHGTEVIPRTLASVDPLWVLEHCDLSDAPNGWDLSSAECDVHDFGVGLILLTWTPNASQSMSSGELNGLVEELERASRTAVSMMTQDISAACRDALADDPARLDLARGLDVENVAVLPPVGSVLWIWHLMMVSCADGGHAALVEEIASVVCPNDYRVLKHRDHSFAAGVYASVACSTSGKESDARFMVRAMRAQDPWWTLFWRLDRVLLSLQLRLEASFDANAPGDLRKRADILYDVSSRVSLLRSRLDSLLVSSGARDIAAWNVLAEAWDMPYRISVVDKKMALLSRAYTEAVAKISSSQTSRVNFMIYVFTALSVVASVVAVAQFTQGMTDDRFLVRIAIVLVSILAALLAVFLSIRTTRVVRASLHRPAVPDSPVRNRAR